VAKLLGTSNSVAEKHYTPWVKELQERAGRAILSLPDCESELRVPLALPESSAGPIPRR